MAKAKAPKKDRTLVAVWLTGADLDRLDAAAKAHRQTRSGLIRLALDRMIAEKEGAA